MDGNIELRHLRYFRAVAEEQHFGRAAVRLGIHQPPLSQQIHKLEAMLGYPLFVRTPKGAQLTAAGRDLLTTAGKLEETLAKGVEQARRISQGRSGKLSIAFAPSLVNTRLPTIFCAYRTRFPEIDLNLVEMPTTAQIEAIHDETIDLGFLREKTGDSRIDSEPVFHEQLVAVLPRLHPLAKNRMVRIGQLMKEPFVLFPRKIGTDFHDRITGLCREAGFTPNIAQEAIEWYTLIHLVGANMGIAIAPVSVSKMRNSGVVVKALTPVAHTSVCLARSKRALSPQAAAFIHATRSSFGGVDTFR
jgi:DNA-binding transcriptional LysR family regulator